MVDQNAMLGAPASPRFSSGGIGLFDQLTSKRSSTNNKVVNLEIAGKVGITAAA